MTLFGIIWACIILYCFIKKDIKYMFSVTLIFMTFQCVNVLNFGGSGVGPQVLTSICFIAKYFIFTNFKLSRVRSDKGILAVLALMTVAVTIIVSGVVNNNLLDKFLVTIQLFVYMAVFLLMRRTSKYITKDELYKIARTIIVFVVVVGAIQVFVTMFFPSARFILKYVFYNDSSTDVYFNHNDLRHNRRIYSTFMEPSYLAVFAVGAFYYLLCLWDKIKRNIVLIISLLIIIIASLSSTAYGAFVITGLLFIGSSKEIKPKWKLLILSVGAVMTLAFFAIFYDVLDTVIFSKAATGSGVTRARWNREAYAAFLTSPIIGIGYKAVRGSSVISTLLGELGIVGAASFVLFNVSSVWKAFYRGMYSRKYSLGYYGVLYAVISSFVCMIIACPDIDLCSYWFWLYMLAVYNGHELIKFRKRKVVSYYRISETTPYK